MWPNTSSNGLKPRDSCTDSLTSKSKKGVYLNTNLFLCPNSMILSYFSRSDEIFQGHLDFQDDILMTYELFDSKFMHNLQENTDIKGQGSRRGKIGPVTKINEIWLYCMCMSSVTENILFKIWCLISAFVTS